MPDPPNLPAGSEQHTGPLEPAGRTLSQRQAIFGEPDVASLTAAELALYEANLARIDQGDG